MVFSNAVITIIYIDISKVNGKLKKEGFDSHNCLLPSHPLDSRGPDLIFLK